MSGKMALVAVGGWALVTFIRLVSRLVYLHMLYKVFLMAELFPTFFTGVHLDWFPCVYHLKMSVQMTLVSIIVKIYK